MEDLAERLRELGGELGIPGLEQLAGHAELCTATADSPLQPGECVVVLAGHLELVRADDGRCIAAFGRGAMLGGSGAADREVTLRSAGAEVARIAAAGFDHLLAVDPVCLAKLTEWIAGGERSLQVAIHLLGASEQLIEQILGRTLFAPSSPFGDLLC